MTEAQLPSFRYHPDPFATGSFEKSDSRCRCCGDARGYVYVGPVFAKKDLDESICPWCIADGSAHERWGCEFIDPDAIGDRGRWDVVPEAVVDEIAHRTPGFAGWQEERWFTCCNDGALFLGPFGRAELVQAGPEAIEAIREEVGYADDIWPRYLAALDRSGQPTAYLFRCRHCGRYGGYSDCS